MRLSDLEPGQAARLAGQNQRKIIVVRPRKQLFRTGDSEVRAVVLHDPGNVMKLGDCFTTNFDCEPVNFRFDGIDEPAPRRDAWDGDADFARMVAKALRKPHWQGDIDLVKRAYYNGVPCQWRRTLNEGTLVGNWRDLRTYRLPAPEFRAHYGTPVGLGWSNSNEYRIKPQENT